MRKFTLFIASLFLALGAMAQNTIDLTFNRNNSAAGTDATVSVARTGDVDVTGITSTIACNYNWKAFGASSETFPNSSILCPDKNTKDMTGDAAGVITLTLAGVPDNYEFTAITLKSVALNGGGAFQGDNTNAQHIDFILKQGDTTIAECKDVAIKVNSNGGESVTVKLDPTTPITAVNGTVTLKLNIINNYTANGCFYGLFNVAIDTKVVMEEQPVLISRNDWSVAASSQETKGDPGQATNAIDGNNSTFWHTVYAETYPHWIEFDMKKTYTVYSFDYVSRFDNTTSNGNILNYKLYISNSAMNGNYENATLAASGTFVYGQGVNHLIQLETPVAGRYVALVAESGTCGNWGGNAAKTAANCAEFKVYGIEKPAETNEEATRELGQLFDWVISFDQVKELVGDKVGQYSSSDPDFGYKFYEIAEFHKSITEETTIEAIEEKIAELEALIETFSPNMPVNGKAYTFKNVQKDGTTVCWFTYKNGKIELTTNEAEAAAFICRKLENGKYAFAINDGKYMAWRGSSAGENSASGIFNAYDNTWTLFTIAKMTTGTQISADCTETRYVTLNGRRLNSPGDNNEFNYTVIKKNNGNPIFDQSNVAFYNNNHSSAFIMDEVVYANKPTLNAVGTSELLTSDLHNKAMATFSAPFPTVVPAGVTAYYATDGDGYVSLQKIDGAIPANTGVILVGENANNAIMVPAAGETIATVESNVLAHSAGANVEISAGCGYILTAKGGVAGFYKATTGTLAMNKAYIAVNGIQESVEVRFPGTTGIEKVEIRNEKEEIFDLTGRRVNEITKAGIYIVNGKKMLVK